MPTGLRAGLPTIDATRIVRDKPRKRLQRRAWYGLHQRWQSLVLAGALLAQCFRFNSHAEQVRRDVLCVFVCACVTRVLETARYLDPRLSTWRWSWKFLARVLGKKSLSDAWAPQQLLMWRMLLEVQCICCKALRPFAGWAQTSIEACSPVNVQLAIKATPKSSLHCLAMFTYTVPRGDKERIDALNFSILTSLTLLFTLVCTAQTQSSLPHFQDLTAGLGKLPQPSLWKPALANPRIRIIPASQVSPCIKLRPGKLCSGPFVWLLGLLPSLLRLWFWQCRAG